MTLTREQFNEMDFEEIMDELCMENNEVTDIELLKDCIKDCIDNDDFSYALHLIESIYNDPDTSDSDWYLYDYSMGTMSTPVCVSSKEDIEHLITFIEEE